MSTAPRYAAFQSASFRALFLGLIVSNVGTWMQNVAQSWLIFRMTGNDPMYLGLLGVSFALPMTLVPPIGGALVDRVDRVRLLRVTQSSALILAAVMALLAYSGRLAPWHILAASFLNALILAFDNPGRQSLVPDLVPREHLANALSLNAATFTGAALIGPALAGVLLVPLGPAWLFALNALSYLAVLLPLSRIRPAARAHTPATSWSEAVLGGLRYARSSRAIRELLLLSAAAALCGRSFVQLLPLFAADVFHAGPSAYGALLSAAGGGAVVGALALSSARDVEPTSRIVLGSGVALAVLLGAFARAPWLPLAIALLVGVGVAQAVFTTMIATKIQLDVPGALRGRVIGLYTITLIGLPSLGSLGMATLARNLGDRASGARDAVTVGALALLGVVLVFGRVGSRTMKTGE